MFPKVHVEREVLEVFPDVQVFSLAVDGLKACPELMPLSVQRLQQACEQLRSTVESTDALVQVPVVAQWRQAYRTMGIKASEYRCSFEALARRAIAGKSLTTGIEEVDVYNAASLAHFACIGAFDADVLRDAMIDMRMCRPVEDQFAPLGGEPGHFPLRAGVVVYAQGREILCWGMNHRDSATTCLSAATSSAIFLAEGVTRQHSQNALNALTALRNDFQSIGLQTSDVVTCRG